MWGGEGPTEPPLEYACHRERTDLMGCSMILEQSFTQLCISGWILKVEGVEPTDKRECEGTFNQRFKDAPAEPRGRDAAAEDIF